LKDLDEVLQEALEAVRSSADPVQLDRARVHYLGKKGAGRPRREHTHLRLE
jgi:hypothetical protein